MVHSAAYTNVYCCEKEKVKTFRVNVLGTRDLSIAVRNIAAKFFYISTDYIFDGEKGGTYYEYDSLDPKTIYGMPKLLEENFVKEQ